MREARKCLHDGPTRTASGASGTGLRAWMASRIVAVAARSACVERSASSSAVRSSAEIVSRKETMTERPLRVTFAFFSAWKYASMTAPNFLRATVVSRDQDDVAVEGLRLLMVAVHLVRRGLDLGVDLLERLLDRLRREATLEEFPERHGGIHRSVQARRREELLRALGVRLDADHRQTLGLRRGLFHRLDARPELLLRLANVRRQRIERGLKGSDPGEPRAMTRTPLLGC